MEIQCNIQINWQRELTVPEVMSQPVLDSDIVAAPGHLCWAWPAQEL